MKAEAQKIVDRTAGMIREQRLAILIETAREQNRAGNMVALAATIKEMDPLWRCDFSAMQFYTSLEKEAAEIERANDPDFILAEGERAAAEY